MTDDVELTLRFEPPVEAVDLRDRFQTLADEMDTLVEEQSEEQESEVRSDGGVVFDYFVSQVRISTYGFRELGDDDRESEAVYRGWTQITADTLDEAVPETNVELKTLLERDPPTALTDGGVRTDGVTTRHTVEQFPHEDEACLLTDGAGPEELPPLHAGDHVQDRDDPDAPMVVMEVSPHAAHEYRLEGTSKTVAEVNEAYPANDDVVEVVYPGRDDDDLAALKRYAFPRSRLELVSPVHDRDDDQEGSDA